MGEAIRKSLSENTSVELRGSVTLYIGEVLEVRAVAGELWQ